MITIDRLRIHLPPGFERRAARIARLTGAALAGAAVPAGPFRADRLRVQAGALSPATGDRAAAAAIAQGLRRAITAGRPGSGGR